LPRREHNQLHLRGLLGGPMPPINPMGIAARSFEPSKRLASKGFVDHSRAALGGASR